ncbi:MAG: hypothetical protein R3E18_01640 [Sphingomonadaceae bacterium]
MEIHYKSMIPIAVGVVMIAAVAAFYLFAPCSIFGGWGLPNAFYGLVWPALMPAIGVWIYLSLRQGAGGTRHWIWVGWVLLGGLVVYGWGDGYLTTYFWRQSSGAPWPEFC